MGLAKFIVVFRQPPSFHFVRSVNYADRIKIFAFVRQLEQSVAALVGSFRLGNVIKNGVQVAIIGKPNAPKSILLNTLLNDFSKFCIGK